MAKKETSPGAGMGADSSAAAGDDRQDGAPDQQAEAAAAAAAVLESLRKENEQLQGQVKALTGEAESLRHELVETQGLKSELEAAVQSSQAAAHAQRERHDAPLLRVLKRASEKAQKSGDGRTHQALEQVLITLAEARHRVKEAAKVARGEGLELLEDLEELLD